MKRASTARRLRLDGALTLSPLAREAEERQTKPAWRAVWELVVLNALEYFLTMKSVHG
jgi:hypothetical protein